MIRAMVADERRQFGQVMQRMADYKRELDAPIPWSEALDMLLQAEAETARALDEADHVSERLRVTLEETTDPDRT